MLVSLYHLVAQPSEELLQYDGEGQGEGWDVLEWRHNLPQDRGEEYRNQPEEGPVRELVDSCEVTNHNTGMRRDSTVLSNVSVGWGGEIRERERERGEREREKGRITYEAIIMITSWAWHATVTANRAATGPKAIKP